ncbi:atp synthase subunit k-like protein [Diplodia corticola]|uniref:Atp synthase subunit k-like protein n=1 Tax=Diplodia corticola TaxID=236234 RepID=A0A1J9QJT1_9PEZI|nr:atp synthase subunit k-like protein [Diplodia corticola]OJD28744.1 atp synthase subunit k-like protein [Diplodia corticola]
MVVYYEIAGRKIGSHVLAMGVLGTLFGGIFAATGGSKKVANVTPPINAASKDEENFIQYASIVLTLRPLANVLFARSF